MSATSPGITGKDFEAFLKTPEGAAAMAEAAPAAPPPPPTPAPAAAAPTPAPAAASVAAPVTPPPAAAAPRKLKVALPDGVEEVDEAAFTDPESEHAKAFRQRIIDDRKRAADAALAEASKRNVDQLQEQGIVRWNPMTGQYEYTDEYVAFQRRRAAPPAEVPPTPPAADPRRAKLAELRAKALEDGDRETFLEYTELATQLAAEDAEKRSLKTIADQRAVEQRQRQEADTVKLVSDTVEAALKRNEAAWIDPATGKVDPTLREDARTAAYNAITTSRNLAQGVATVERFAARNAGVQAHVQRLAKPPTAAPAASPQFGGGAPSAAAPAAKFDPNRPFADWKDFVEKGGLN